MLRLILLTAVIGLMASCTNKSEEGSATVVDVEIKDLPFEAAQTPKEFADIVLKAIKTNRDRPIFKQLVDSEQLDYEYFNSMIGMYSTGIGGRDDWEFRDVHDETGAAKDATGFDFAWLDPRDRLGIQIYIEPVKQGDRYFLRRLELRSRLEVMRSISFPDGAEISDYKKLDFNWTPQES
ncbi:MAG: hypothetical protein AAFR14_04410 [Bacteroidota bacterium]